jgi:hypothetical protein
VAGLQPAEGALFEIHAQFALAAEEEQQGNEDQADQGQRVVAHLEQAVAHVAKEHRDRTGGRTTQVVHGREQFLKRCHVTPFFSAPPCWRHGAGQECDSDNPAPKTGGDLAALRRACGNRSAGAPWRGLSLICVRWGRILREAVITGQGLGLNFS